MFCHKICVVCSVRYVPTGGRQERCPNCRLTHAQIEKRRYDKRRADPDWWEARKQKVREYKKRSYYKRKEFLRNAVNSEDSPCLD